MSIGRPLWRIVTIENFCFTYYSYIPHHNLGAFSHNKEKEEVEVNLNYRYFKVTDNSILHKLRRYYTVMLILHHDISMLSCVSTYYFL